MTGGGRRSVQKHSETERLMAAQFLPHGAVIHNSQTAQLLGHGNNHFHTSKFIYC